MQSRLSTPYIYVIEQTGSSPGYELHICNQNQTGSRLVVMSMQPNRCDHTFIYKQFDMLYVVFSFSNYLAAYFQNNLIIKLEEKRKNQNVVGFSVLVDPWSRVVLPTGTRGPPQARACAATWEPVVPGHNGPATRGGGLQSRLGSPGWTPGTRGPYGRELEALFPLVLIHAMPIHPSLCLQCFNRTVYCDHQCCYYFAATTTAIKLLLLIICVEQDYLQVQVN